MEKGTLYVIKTFLIIFHHEQRIATRNVSRILLRGCSRSYFPFLPDLTIKKFSGGVLKVSLRYAPVQRMKYIFMSFNDSQIYLYIIFDNIVNELSSIRP